MTHPACLTCARLARDLEDATKELGALREALAAAERRADEFEDKYGETLFALMREQAKRKDWQTRCKRLQAKLERREDAQRNPPAADSEATLLTFRRRAT